MNEIRILVCGGRTYGDARTLGAVLSSLARDLGHFTVIHGGARGADSLAASWAAARGCRVVEFPAEWHIHGKKAGSIRNQRMIDDGRPHGVVAFPGGPGTADMIRRSRAAELPVWVLP